MEKEHYFIKVEEEDGRIVEYAIGEGAFKLNFGEHGNIIQVWDDEHSWIVPQERLVVVRLPNLGRGPRRA